MTQHLFGIQLRTITYFYIETIFWPVIDLSKLSDRKLSSYQPKKTGITIPIFAAN